MVTIAEYYLRYITFLNFYISQKQKETLTANQKLKLDTLCQELWQLEDEFILNSIDFCVY